MSDDKNPDKLDPQVWGGLGEIGFADPVATQQKDMAEECLEADNLTPWEEDFLVDILKHLGTRRRLTDGQYSKLEEIWSEKVTWL